LRNPSRTPHTTPVGSAWRSERALLPSRARLAQRPSKASGGCSCANVRWNGRAGALGATRRGLGAGPLRRPPTEGLSATGGVGPAGRCRGPGPSGLLAARAGCPQGKSRAVWEVPSLKLQLKTKGVCVCAGGGGGGGWGGEIVMRATTHLWGHKAAWLPPKHHHPTCDRTDARSFPRLQAEHSRLASGWHHELPYPRSSAVFYRGSASGVPTRATNCPRREPRAVRHGRHRAVHSRRLPEVGSPSIRVPVSW
jgi:hypothetical protein